MTYVALLRGINVGGKNMIKMAELRAALSAVGLGAVQTYIQSGNILFQSDMDETTLRQTIEHTIESHFGLTVPVVLRTAAELNHIIEACPFLSDDITQAQAESGVESLYVALLGRAPTQESIGQAQVYVNSNEKMIASGRNVYLLFHQSIRKSKLATHLTKLDESATVRNWKTLTKLAALAKAMEE